MRLTERNNLLVTSAVSELIINLVSENICSDMKLSDINHLLAIIANSEQIISAISRDIFAHI